jgi:hypothetical protein
MPFWKRLYVWSVIFEPLFYFVVFEETTSGVTGNVSRILQVAVVAILAARFVVWWFRSQEPYAVIPGWRHPLFNYWYAYFAIGIVAGTFGALSGAYAVPPGAQAIGHRSALSAFINAPGFRPFVEYIASAYYIVYFAVIPRYILTTRAELEYAFSSFRWMFTLSYVIGVIDVILARGFGLYWVPRHLVDGLNVEGRFHGLAGEPRQAFVYLFLGLAIFHLEAYFRGRPVNRQWTFAIIAAAFFVQSTTGLLGIAIFVALAAIFYLPTLDARRRKQALALMAAVTILAGTAALSSSRVRGYVSDASDLWTTLEQGKPLSYLMSKSNSDIYPLYDLIVKARNHHFLPILIGSGKGSASVTANRYYLQLSVVNNPHSELVRVLYETGLIGTWCFLMAFVYPVRTMTKRLSKERQSEFLLMMLVVLGCSLADRSAAPYIYLGMFAAVWRISDREARQA